MSTEKSVELDAIVIGTGFAGAVTACRLVEAGLKICVLERGRRYGPEDFPKYPTEDLFASDPGSNEDTRPVPDFSRWLWSTDSGLYDVRDLDHTVSVQAAGYGGGSLIYANVHLRPPRDVFEQGWPQEYAGGTLDPYFDLAAYMLRVRPIPQQLAKTLQLRRAARELHKASGDPHWFRTPLAVSFDAPRDEVNDFGREQHSCDMRGRCFRGCDRLAKNTLDRNYLARAEDVASDGATPPDIRTLAEVVKIGYGARNGKGLFTVMYRDLLLRDNDEEETPRRRVRFLRAPSVFLCAGAVNTTELLLRNPRALRRNPQVMVPLGAHYFPNTDSLAVAFDCDEPHEADYGPTITSALLYQSADRQNVDDRSVRHALDFRDGYSRVGDAPAGGMPVKGLRSHASATLVVEPILDWGDWKKGAVGALVLENVTGTFEGGEALAIGDDARAVTCTPSRPQKPWFLTEDGGYPPDFEALVGIFRSPLWLRRNRYLEADPARPTVPERRAPSQPLLVRPFSDALGATSRRSASSRGVLARSFAPDLSLSAGTASPAAGATTESLVVPRILTEQVTNLFPDWFVTAIENNRKELFHQATAMALPMLGRLLGELSKNVAKDIDPVTLARLGGGNVDQDKVEVLVRGMLRQGLQILAGSEAAVATAATRTFFERVPGTPEDLLRVAGDLLLWALVYGHNDRHTGVLLTLGRDLHRGRLCLAPDGNSFPTKTLKAVLANRVVDTASMAQEHLLREIARNWNGELRTNPAWTSLGKGVTVHSQGGCPMGDDGNSVTNAWGEVHGCPGLYVMDAAAFPTSVGVNPSATIAAVAEFKIERFIREWRTTHKNDATNTWSAPDHEGVQEWFDRYGRPALDPLNHGAVGIGATSGPDGKSPVIGLSFEEHMTGWVSDVDPNDATDWGDLDGFPARIFKFIQAENAGIIADATINVDLLATVNDLARLISTAPGLGATRVEVTGHVGTSSDGQSFDLTAESFIQLFLRPRIETVPTRFFRYHLEFMDGTQLRVMDALKLLRDSAGFDAWHDTSTLYFEVRDPGRLQRGVVRVSFERFLREQLRNMDVTGTNDPTRRSWALAAFYKYFARELLEVYAGRTETVTQLLGSLLTEIHV